MAKTKKNRKKVLIDLHYKYSMNHFEEFYGESISYSSIEQESYIDLKEMAFEKISKDINFRKFGRENNVLTVKMDISESDYNSFVSILNNEKIDVEKTNESEDVKYVSFNFLHDFTITNLRDLTNEERIRFKKAIVEPEEEESLIEDDDLD